MRRRINPAPQQILSLQGQLKNHCSSRAERWSNWRAGLHLSCNAVALPKSKLWRKKKKTRRKRGDTRIYTDNPVRDEIAEQKEKKIKSKNTSKKGKSSAEKALFESTIKHGIFWGKWRWATCTIDGWIRQWMFCRWGHYRGWFCHCPCRYMGKDVQNTTSQELMWMAMNIRVFFCGGWPARYTLLRKGPSLWWTKVIQPFLIKGT